MGDISYCSYSISGPGRHNLCNNIPSARPSGASRTTTAGSIASSTTPCTFYNLSQTPRCSFRAPSADPRFHLSRASHVVWLRPHRMCPGLRCWQHRPHRLRTRALARGPPVVAVNFDPDFLDLAQRYTFGGEVFFSIVTTPSIVPARSFYDSCCLLLPSIAPTSNGLRLDKVSRTR